MNDLISRQAAIDAIEYWHGIDASEALGRLPSAQPERKTGHWIEHNPHKWGLGITFECSECGCSSLDATEYCPDCGSPMEGVEE